MHVVYTRHRDNQRTSHVQNCAKSYIKLAFKLYQKNGARIEIQYPLVITDL
jgi:hypothetical protein